MSYDTWRLAVGLLIFVPLGLIVASYLLDGLRAIRRRRGR